MATTHTSRTTTFPEEGIKAPCVVSSSSNIALSGEQTIGSTSVVTGDRVLVRANTDTTENGIWQVETGSWTRPSDWNNGNDVSSGMLVTDTANSRLYIAKFTGSFVAGTTEVTIGDFSVSGAGLLAGVNTWTGINTFVAKTNLGEVDIDGTLTIDGDSNVNIENGSGLWKMKRSSNEVYFNDGFYLGSNLDTTGAQLTHTPANNRFDIRTNTSGDDIAINARDAVIKFFGQSNYTLAIRPPIYANKTAADAAYSAASASPSEADSWYSQTDDGWVSRSGAGTWLLQDGSAAT